MPIIKKIILFIEAHFNRRDYDRFGIETLNQNGFDVEVWDFTPFLTRDAYQKIRPPDPINWEKVISFKNKGEALSAISNLSQSCFVIPIIHYNYQTLVIFRMLSKKKIAFSSCVQSSIVPISTSSKEHLLRRLKGFIKRLKKLNGFYIRNVIQRKFMMIPFELLGVKPANIVLAPAEKYITSVSPINKKSQILWVHSLDYDIYLRERDAPVSIDHNMGVFIDQFHGTDMISLGRPAAVISEEYYPLLCRYFDCLEKKMCVRIVIAAHPRSRYEKQPDIFGGRQIVRGKTAELVNKSSFVLLHNSFATNYAVLFKKPMIFLTTNKINQNFVQGTVEDPSVEWLSAFFGKRAHNLNEKIEIDDIEEELFTDEKAYKVYKNAYIKKDGTEELPFWQIFANHIKNFK